MNKLIDVTCPNGHERLDVWAELGQLPTCPCGEPTLRLWRTAPGITPQGTRPERGRNVSRPNRVDATAIAAETTREVEAKWLRYSDEKIAEQAVSREINHKAGIADEMGNPKALPTPAPIVMERAE